MTTAQRDRIVEILNPARRDRIVEIYHRPSDHPMQRVTHSRDAKKWRTSKRKFESTLMAIHKGDVSGCRVKSDDPDDLTDGGSPWVWLYYTSSGLTDAERASGKTSAHVATWRRGEGSTFRKSLLGRAY